MKKFRIMAIASLAFASAFALASCNKDDGSVKDKDSYNIGILQIVSHDALDKATQGFKDYINANKPADKTVTYDFQNPQGDQATLLTMSNKLVKKCDLVLGNATPAATQLVSSAKGLGKKKRPILFTSVTDPVDAKLVSAWDSHKGEYVSGTSDINPVEAQIEMMFEIDPTVDKVGFLYNISETNSETQCNTAKTYLTKNHSAVATMTQTVSAQNEITGAANALVNAGCDFIYVPTDNLMAANVTTITNVTDTKKVPLICGEEGMVTSGGTFTFSIDYYELGRTTGRQACEILFEKKSIDEVAVVAQTDSSKMKFAYNAQAVEKMGLTLSQEFKTKYNIK